MRTHHGELSSRSLGLRTFEVYSETQFGVYSPQIDEGFRLGYPRWSTSSHLVTGPTGSSTSVGTGTSQCVRLSHILGHCPRMCQSTRRPKWTATVVPRPIRQTYAKQSGAMPRTQLMHMISDRLESNPQLINIENEDRNCMNKIRS